MSNAFSSQGTYLYVKKGSSTFDDVTFAASGKTITLASGNWDTAHDPGDVITTDSIDNPGPFTISTITGSNKILTVTGVVANENAADNVTVTRYSQLGEVTSIDGPTSTADPIEVTHLLSTRAERVAGRMDSGKISLNLNYIPDDAGLILARSAQEEQSKTTILIVWSDGGTFAESSSLHARAIVSEFGVSTGENSAVMGKITFTLDGAITYVDAS